MMRGSTLPDRTPSAESRMVPSVDSPVRKRHADNPRRWHLERVLEAPLLAHLAIGDRELGVEAGGSDSEGESGAAVLSLQPVPSVSA
jgi:hypothetical protein